MTPFEINPSNNFLLDIIKPSYFDNDFYDDMIKVYHTGNDHYLVRDHRQSIQFRFKKNELDLSIIDKNDGFADEPFFAKIAAQNVIDDELIERNDSFYVTCLLAELERIINHVENCYPEFNNNSNGDY